MLKARTNNSLSSNGCHFQVLTIIQQFNSNVCFEQISRVPIHLPIYIYVSIYLSIYYQSTYLCCILLDHRMQIRNLKTVSFLKDLVSWAQNMMMSMMCFQTTACIKLFSSLLITYEVDLKRYWYCFCEKHLLVLVNSASYFPKGTLQWERFLAEVCQKCCQSVKSAKVSLVPFQPPLLLALKSSVPSNCPPSFQAFFQLHLTKICLT